MSLHDLKIAIRLHRNGKLGAAHEAYCKLVQNRPEDARLISLLGQLQLQMGKTTTAIEHLRQAVGLAPEDQRITLTLARGLAAGGHHGEAIGIVHKVLADDDASAEAWSTLAAVHRHHNNRVNELVALERATELAPDDVPALIARANAEAANGHLDKAVETLRSAAQLAPGNARVINNLGALYLGRNNLGAAEAAFLQALRIAPKYTVAVVNLAVTLHRLGKLEPARQMAQRALRLAPGNRQARTELSSILLAQDDPAGAEAGFMAVLETESAHQGALAGMAELRERQGRATEGLRLVSEVIDSGQASPNIRLVGAGLAHRIGRREIALEMLAPLLDDAGDPAPLLDRSTHRRLRFLLGDIYDASADYGAALGHYTAANSVLRPEYDAQVLYRYVDEIIASFDADTVSRRRDADSRTPRRIFLVGLPRAGTGLLDSMLARHPAVQACGALPLLGQLINEERFPAGFADLGNNELNTSGDRYRSSTAAPAEIKWMTDRMPLNFFYLGSIALMLPDSLIIHCKRDPADTLLSCYFQNFADPALAFSSDLDNLSHYWHNYNRLMRHWQSIIGGMIIEMHYEQLVADPESSMRQLLQRLNLDWDREVLNPEMGRRHVSASAHTPVGEPVHSRSVGRFARYRPFWRDRVDIAALSHGAGPLQPGD